MIRIYRATNRVVQLFLYLLTLTVLTITGVASLAIFVGYVTGIIR